MSSKKCNKCNIEKNFVYFQYKTPRNNIFEENCIDCNNINQICKTCNKSKKIYYFTLINKNKKIYDENCQSCVTIISNKKKEEAKQKRKEASKLRYIEKKEHILEINKIWRDNNKQYRREKDKEYRNKDEVKQRIKEKNIENKDERKIYLKEYAEKHKDEKKNYDQEYRLKNKEKYQTDEYKEKRNKRAKIKYDENKEEILKKNNERRKYENPKYKEYMNTIRPVLARKLNTKIGKNKYKIDITIDDLLNIWATQNGKCYLSNINMTTLSSERSLKNVSIDQIDAGKGYIKNNVGLCCESINMSKMQMSKDEFLEQLNKAGKNINDKFYEKIINKNEIDENCKKYLLNLFNIKKLTKKIGIDNILNLYKKQNGKCAITGIEMTFEKNNDIKYRSPTNISVDKINPKLGYVLDNIQLTCLWANTGKLNYNNDEYRNLLLEAYNNIKN